MAEDYYKLMQQLMRQGYHPFTQNAELEKAAWKATAQRYFKELVKDMGPTEWDVSFNPAGCAVSGDISMMALVWRDRGIHIFGNIDNICGAYLVARTINSLKDYTGGPNNLLPITKMDEQEFKDRVGEIMWGRAYERSNWKSGNRKAKESLQTEFGY